MKQALLTVSILCIMIICFVAGCQYKQHDFMQHIRVEAACLRFIMYLDSLEEENLDTGRWDYLYDEGYGDKREELDQYFKY